MSAHPSKLHIIEQSKEVKQVCRNYLTRTLV